MNIVGKIAVNGAKIVGTAVVGTAGVMLLVVEDGLAKQGGGRCDNSMSSGCFTLVKKMWGAEDTPSFDDTMRDMKKGAQNNKVKMEKIGKQRKKELKEALENKEKMKRLLLKIGEDPRLADDDRFMEAMKEKYGE